MGKPFNDDEGSGLHLHVSFVDADGNNVCDDAGQPEGLGALDPPLPGRRARARAGR